MISIDRLREIVKDVSFGGFRPLITIETAIQITSQGERPAILIGLNTVDAMSTDTKSIRLYECFAAPDIEDTKLALWIKERCQDVLLHEMDEFFRFRDKIVERAVHPVAEGVYEHIRQRAVTDDVERCNDTPDG